MTYPAAGMRDFLIAVTNGAEKLEATSSGSAVPTQTGGIPAESTSAKATATIGTATKTSEAASGTSTGAAAARGLRKEIGVLAAILGMGSLWL